MKIKTIKLSDKHPPVSLIHKNEEEFKQAQRFRVEQITDSIEYQTGDILDRREVEYLCKNDNWKVTIVPQR